MKEEFAKTLADYDAKFKKVNKNFDLKEICGSETGPIDGNAPVGESGNSEKLKSFTNFIEMQRYLLKKPFEKIDESEARSKKRILETENDIAVKLKNTNLII
jgi:hypothetical protein